MNQSIKFEPLPKIFKGKNVLIEPLGEEHVNEMYAIGRDESIWSFLPRPSFQSLEDTKKWVFDSIELTKKKEQVVFVLIDPQSDRVIGSTRFLNIREKDRGLEIGFSWLGLSYQRTAVNTETKFLLLTYAFEELKAHRVEFKTDLRNKKSQRAIERLGAKKEGVFRKHMLTQGGFVRDSVFYSVIQEEWPDVKEKLKSYLGA